MYTIAFSQAKAQLHQPADDEPCSDSGSAPLVGSKPPKLGFPTRAAMTVAVASVLGCSVLALHSARFFKEPRKSQQVAPSHVTHAPIGGAFLGRPPQLPPPAAALPVGPPAVDAAAATEEGRAAVARLGQALKECNGQSSSRRLTAAVSSISYFCDRIMMTGQIAFGLVLVIAVGFLDIQAYEHLGFNYLLLLSVVEMALALAGLVGFKLYQRMDRKTDADEMTRPSQV
eukprot:GHVT01058502.1.p1 GENE.GHVT01058502.1~~GHVT01058502.1.p1  ORF type:complete len:229 (-),score=31.62 GHVT01058502.1:141-827(-)